MKFVLICECGRPFDDIRAQSLHFYQGCDAAIADCFKDGETVEELARRFRKPKYKIENIIRLETMRRRRQQEMFKEDVA